METHRRLAQYLSLAGFPPGPVSFSQQDAGIFLTNAVLCLPGGDSMRTELQPAELGTCATRFLKATLQLVEPKVVATLGVQATNAVLHACGLPPTREFSQLVRSEAGLALSHGMVLFAMFHPTASRTKAEHEAAWRRVRTWFERA